MKYTGCPEGFAPGIALGAAKYEGQFAHLLAHVSFFGSVGGLFVTWSQFSAGISVDCC